MNNKGFAITSILYGLLMMFLIIIVGTLGTLANQKRLMEELIDGDKGAREIVGIKSIETDDYDNVNSSSTIISNREEIKEALQNYVVSTAKSYLWNQEYSDYDQGNLDMEKTFKWRDLTISPDEISRNNNYHIDCSSFVSSVYNNSLFFDFSDYFQFSASNVFNKDFTVSALKDTDAITYKKEFATTGGGPSTLMFDRIGSNSTIGDNKLVVYYSSVANDKCIYSDKVDEMYSMLQSGDLMVYRHRGSSTGGHVMIYVPEFNDKDGNTITGGFIHATGYGYKYDELDMQEDLYSVQAADKSDFDSRLKKNCQSNGVPTDANKEYITSIMILRPINKILEDNCKEDNTCSVRVSKNAIARDKFSEMRIEQYAKIGDSSDVDVNLGKYQSVGEGDKIRYILYLGNNNLREYNGFNIMAQIPEGTTYVGCNNSCSFDGETITWNNASNKYSGNNSKYRVYHYTVMVDKNNGHVINKGMKITTSSGEELHLSKIVTDVNNTIRDNQITQSIKNAIIAQRNGYISFNGNSTEYKKKISELSDSNKLELSPQGFIRMIYYDAYDTTSLGDITKDRIKANLFLTNGNIYAKKNTGTIDIDKKLVAGLYGGRYLYGNFNNDRTTYITTKDLEIGDVIFYFYHTDSKPTIAGISSAYIYDRDNNGNPVFIKYSSNGIEVYVSGTYTINNDKKLSQLITYDPAGINYNNYAATSGNSGYVEEAKTSQQLLREIYAQDLFAVFRPSKVM